MNTDQFLNYLSNAESLIIQAGNAVNCFFVSNDKFKKDKTTFTGFIRDSLIRDRNFMITTGGGSVAANLFRISSHLQYLRSNKLIPVTDLIRNRDLARTYVMEAAPQREFSESPSFLKLSPLTYSVYSIIASKTENTSDLAKRRSAFFNAINLYYFLLPKWPVQENVDRAHPFIAYKVQGAVLSVVQKGGQHESDVIDIAGGNLRPEVFHIEPDNDNFKRFDERLATVSKYLKSIVSSRHNFHTAIESAKLDYQEQAERYLWEQIGHAPGQQRTLSDPILYDPVGACFSLQILLLGFRRPEGGYDIQAFLGRYSGLVSRSISHILNSLSESGSFPYGAPFSYKPNGTVGFTTSTNGLAALSHFMVKLLLNSRKADYPWRKFLKSLLEENRENFEKLFDLPAMFEGTIQRTTMRQADCDFLNQDISLEGWSTDRAFNRNRIESWATIEVFRFSVYLREALHEYMQFFVADRFGAFLPFNEPVWPYEGRAPVRPASNPRGESVLIDPDLEEAEDRDGAIAHLEDRPIYFLHSKFSELMDLPDPSTPWTQEVSSVLLFGPPGTSKSTLSRSLAQRLGWHFLEISPSDFIIGGLEHVEEKAKDLFQNLSSLRETVVLFDELDSLFVDRDLLTPESVINFVVPAMLPKLQALNTKAKNQRLLIVIATNFYDRLDQAMVRPGRIDKHLLVLPYNIFSKLAVLRSLLPDGDTLPEEETSVRTRLFCFSGASRSCKTTNDRNVRERSCSAEFDKSKLVPIESSEGQAPPAY